MKNNGPRPTARKSPSASRMAPPSARENTPHRSKKKAPAAVETKRTSRSAVLKASHAAPCAVATAKNKRTSHHAVTSTKKIRVRASVAKKTAPCAAAAKTKTSHHAVTSTKRIRVRASVAKQTAPCAAAAKTKTSHHTVTSAKKVPVFAAVTKQTVPCAAAATKRTSRHTAASTKKVRVRYSVAKKASPRTAAAAKSTSLHTAASKRKVTRLARAKVSAANKITALRVAEAAKTAPNPTPSKAHAAHQTQARRTTAFRATSPGNRGQESSKKRKKSFATLQQETSASRKRRKPLATTSKKVAATIVESSSSSKKRAKSTAATRHKVAATIVESSSSSKNRAKSSAATRQKVAATSSSSKNCAKSLTTTRKKGTATIVESSSSPRNRRKSFAATRKKVEATKVESSSPSRNRAKSLASPRKKAAATIVESSSSSKNRAKSSAAMRQKVAATAEQSPSSCRTSGKSLSTGRQKHLNEEVTTTPPVHAPEGARTPKRDRPLPISRPLEPTTTSPLQRSDVTPSPSKTAKSPSHAVASTLRRGQRRTTPTPLSQRSANTTLSPLDSAPSGPRESAPDAYVMSPPRQVPKCEDDVFEKTSGRQLGGETPHRVHPRRLSAQGDCRSHSPLRGKRLLFENADGNVEQPKSALDAFKKRGDPDAGDHPNLRQEEQGMGVEIRPEEVETGSVQDASVAQKGLDVASIQLSNEDEEVRKSRELLAVLQARAREPEQSDERLPKASTSARCSPLGASTQANKPSPSDGAMPRTHHAGATLTPGVSTSATSAAGNRSTEKSNFVTPAKKGSGNSSTYGDDSQLHYVTRKKQRRTLEGSLVLTDRKTSTSPRAERSYTPIRRCIPTLIPFDKCRPSPFAGFVYTTQPDELARACGQSRENVMTPPTQKTQYGSQQKKFSINRAHTPEISPISASSMSRRAHCHHVGADGPCGRDAPILVVDRGTTMSPRQVNIMLPGDMPTDHPCGTTSHTATISASPVSRRASCRHAGCRGQSFSRDAPPRFVVDRGTCVSPSRGHNTMLPGDISTDHPPTPTTHTATMSALSSSQRVKGENGGSGVPFSRDTPSKFDCDRARCLFAHQRNNLLLPMTSVFSPAKRLSDSTNVGGTPCSRESPPKRDAKRGTSMFSRGPDSLLLRDTWKADALAPTTQGAWLSAPSSPVCARGVSRARESPRRETRAAPMLSGDVAPSTPRIPTPVGVTTPPTRGESGRAPSTKNEARRSVATPTATSPTAMATTPPPSPRSYLPTSVKRRHVSPKDEGRTPGLLSDAVHRPGTEPCHTTVGP